MPNQVIGSSVRPSNSQHKEYTMITHIILSIIVVVIAQLVLDFIANYILTIKLNRAVTVRNTYSRAKESNWRVGR